jgi:hypothetical protein
MKCKICGGELYDWEDGYEDEQHYNKDTCIEVLQNTLNCHMKNTKMLEETIEKLILALKKIDDQPSNIITHYSITIASEALEDL